MLTRVPGASAMPMILLRWDTFLHLGGHHVEEFGVVDNASAVFAHLGDELLDLFTLGLEAKCAHSDFQFF